MNAYVLGVNSDPDQGQPIVFANTAKEARRLAPNDLDPESFIDLYARRAPEFDGMENLTHKQLMKEQWREGWHFFEGCCPDYEEAEDEEFYKWYDETYN